MRMKNYVEVLCDNGMENLYWFPAFWSNSRMVKFVGELYGANKLDGTPVRALRMCHKFTTVATYSIKKV